MAGSATPRAPLTGWDALRAAEWKQAQAAFEAELTAGETASAFDGRRTYSSSSPRDGETASPEASRGYSRRPTDM